MKDAAISALVPSTLFIVGSGRCGSTLTADLLCLHPDTGFVTNYDNRFGLGHAQWGRSAYQLLPRPVRRQWAAPRPNEGYNALRREVSPLLVAPHRDLTAEDVTPYIDRRLRAFVARRAARQGVSHFTHKFTGWPRSGLVQKVFPETRFVHVVRDGRAVANSLMQQAWWGGSRGPEQWGFGALTPSERETYDRSGQRFEVLAALQWVRLMRAYVDAASSIGDRWITLKYEDLLASPQEALEPIASHGQLDIASARFTRLIREADIVSDRAEAYTTDLDAAAISRIEEVCGPTLQHFGYLR